MSPSAQPALECLVPVLRYRDVAAAAQWLMTAFSFSQKALVPGHDGGAVYAELVHGRSTIMLVPVGQSDLDAHMRQPDELGGIETQTCYVTVEDAAAHLQKAITGGAEIVLPLSGEAGGQRGYSCRDLEGHLWNFGTYAPAIGILTVPSQDPDEDIPQPPPVQNARRRSAAMPALTLGIIGLGAWAWAIPDNPVAATAQQWLQTAGWMAPPGDVRTDTGPVTADPSHVTAAPSAADATALANLQAEARRSHETILKLRQEVADARSSVRIAQEAARAATNDVAAENSLRGEAQHANESAAAKTAKLEADLNASKAALTHLESELLKERSARGQLVVAAEALRGELEKEGQKRQALEQIVDELDRKADERMGATVAPSATAAPNQTAATATEASRLAIGGAAPHETGSIEAHAVSQTRPSDPDTKAASTALRKVPVERSKAVSVKKSRPAETANSSTAKKAPARKKEDKPWPYDNW